MQINRLFELVYLLLDRERMSAKELADHFGVSTRTIYRDVDILSTSGIPLYMTKGKGGGIRLLPDFVLNKAVLTDEEKSNILSALQGLSIMGQDEVQHTLSKLGALFGTQNTSFVEIDYSDWGNVIRVQFEASKQAILTRKRLTFDYVSALGQATTRKVEPYVLWFKDKAWYLRCFCLDKQDIRLFRLSRMRNVRILDEPFLPRSLDFTAADSAACPPTTPIVVRVLSPQIHRILDDFTEDEFVRNEDGSVTVTMRFIEDEWVYGYLLSFGSAATVLAPEYVKDGLRQRLADMVKNYS